MLKKLKKAITLIELVVSISVSVVIFAGVTGLLIFLRNSNESLKDDSKTFYNANTLSHAIESVLDAGNSSLYNLPTTLQVYEDEYQEEVVAVSADTQKLFTVIKGGSTKNYYFYRQHFGYTNGDALLFNSLYTSETKIKIEFNVTDDDQYLLTLYYGESYVNHFDVIKNLYKGA